MEIIIDEDVIEKPTWKIGDQWSMGYTADLSEYADEMKSTMMDDNYLDTKINSFELKGEAGFYQSCLVKDDDVEITIGDTTYECYEVYFEQYVGLAYDAYYDIEMTYPDYSYDDDYYYDDYYDEEYGYYGTRASSSQTLSMKYDMYMWMKGDVTGYIYYTVDELAIAKGVFEMWLDADIDFDMSANIPDEGRMSSKMTYEIEGFYAKFDVVFDDPLDIYDFPIEPYEDWTATSMMTKRLMDLRGRIACEMNANYPYEPTSSVNFEMNLAEEIQTPDIYGPVEVTFEFSNYGSDALRLANGISSDCWIIESDDYWYDDDDDYDYDSFEDYSSSSLLGPDVSLPMDDPSDGFDYDAETIETPVEATAKATNYYSEEDRNIVSYEPSYDSSDLSSSIDSFPSTSYDEPSITPTSYSEVTTFKAGGRDRLLSKYPKETKSTRDKPNDDENPTNMIIFGVLIAIVMIAILAAIGIQISKKRKIPTVVQTQAQTDYGSVPTRQRPEQQQYIAQPELDYHPDHYSMQDESYHPQQAYTTQPQPQPQPEPQYQHQTQPQVQSQYNPYPNYTQQQPQSQPQYQPQQQTQYQQPDYGYNPSSSTQYDQRPTQQQPGYGYNPSSSTQYDPRPTQQPQYPPQSPKYTNDPYQRY
jgi:hypothetical protein